MTTPIITVEHLSKRYHLGQIGATTLRDSAERFIHRLRRRAKTQLSGNGYSLLGKKKEKVIGYPLSVIGEKTGNDSTTNNQHPITDNNSSPNDELWALRDVSFEVQPGEVLGIIGRNGAGKSTLLKILSRITEPTSGRAIIRGRVASLLEVGTGFHPELTGRENIFLNGAILGMRRAEIAGKFDEIVAFSEVERFIDTPVKRYSSGMYVRLAFAVAAHLEPEILIIDEVLAVGDSEFQKKCLGKMGEVAHVGRTVIFVSHNMPAVQQLCDHGVVMEHGAIAIDGTISTALEFYIGSNKGLRSRPLRQRTDRQGNGRVRFTEVEIVNSEGQSVDRVMTGMDVEGRLHYESTTPPRDAAVQVAFNLANRMGHVITNFNSVDTGDGQMRIHRTGVFVCKWPKVSLKSGTYVGALYCSINGEIADWLQDGIEVTVETGDYFGSGQVIEGGQGDLVLMHSWRSFSRP